MKEQPSSSGLESAAGNLLTEAVLTCVAAFSGNPVSALLPVLSNSLASERHKKRIENALTEITNDLMAHEKAIRNLTDEQYKLINEAIVALLHTTSAAKIAYLRRAVSNSLTAEVLPQEAVMLSRMIRDITADEADFVMKNFQYNSIVLSHLANDGEHVVHRHDLLHVRHDSPDSLIVTGLASLGILAGAGSGFNAAAYLQFSPITAKLITLLSKPST